MNGLSTYSDENANLHWLPHQILVYEVRAEEGYGMHWSSNNSGAGEQIERERAFRGFVVEGIRLATMKLPDFEARGSVLVGNA